MTHTFTTDPVPGPGPAQIEVQKFGRIEAVRREAAGAEIDIRQPNGTRLTVHLIPQSIDSGTTAPAIGRNAWVSGRLEGTTMTAGLFAVYADEP